MSENLESLLMGYERSLLAEHELADRARKNIERLEGAVIAVREAITRVASQPAQEEEKPKRRKKTDEEQDQ